MEVVEIVPDELEVDPLNERTENVGPDKDGESLEESIRNQGIIQPPIVREGDNEEYLVIVGQRRTLAAQAVGLEKIPVVVMDFDRAEALQATITENVDAFRKSVSRSDRATAIQELMDINNWSITEIADELGVSPDTVGLWLERTDEAWEGTTVHVDNHDNESSEEVQKTVEDIPDGDLATIRRATDSPEERQKAIKKVQQSGLADRALLEAKKRAENSGDSFDEVIDTLSQEKEKKQKSGIKVEARVTVAGHEAEALQEAAKDLGTSEEDVVRRAVGDFLDSQGYR
jgi:ParB family chromosome partitioning protein